MSTQMEFSLGALGSKCNRTYSQESVRRIAVLMKYSKCSVILEYKPTHLPQNTKDLTIADEKYKKV